jgi:tetratricopeptide (TPR) repeat protein
MNYRAGNKKEAYKYYKKTLKLEPRQLPALNNYAYFLALDGRELKKACKMSKITIEAEPNNPTYLDTYAWILHLMGNHIEAKSVFKHAMMYGGKESAEILDHYAEVLFALKEYDLASIYWSQAHKLNPDLGIEEKARKREKEKKQ